MDIIYLGHSSFKISGKDASVVTDPFDPTMVGIKYPKVSADILTCSHTHADHAYMEGVTDVHKVVSGTGEYEIKGISLIGIKTYHDSVKGAERGENTIYVIEVDGFRLLHLGDLGHKLSEDVLSQIGNIDILMIPCGGHFTIDPKEASEVARSIEPKIVIPMHYKQEGMKEDLSVLSPVEDFVNAMGSAPEHMKKYSIKAGSVLTDEMKLLILDRA